jgi:hypothetical protein
MAKGDHIAVSLSSAVHHGIDCGNGYVVEYEGGNVDEKPVRMVTVDEFTEGHRYFTVHCADITEAELVAWLAQSRLLDVEWTGQEHHQLAA